MKNTIIYSLFLLGFVIAKTTDAQTTTVSGNISLPSGIVAGPAGVEIELRGLFFELNNPLSTQTITIPPEQSSTNYSLTFSEDDQSIVFDCPSCFDLGVTDTGSWNETTGVASMFSGTNYSIGTNNNVDILLEQATTFSGRVVFPNDFASSGNDFIIVTINSATFLTFDSFSDSVILGNGDSNFDFRIGVPSDASADGWTLSAACPFDCDTNLVFQDTNFATTVNGDPTSLNEDDAFIFPSDASYTNIVITLQGPIIEADTPDQEGALVPIINLILDEEE